MAMKKALDRKEPVARKVKEIIVEIEDRIGALAEVLDKLAEKKINLWAYSALSFQEAGVLHLLADNAAQAQRALKQTSATKISASDIVFAICPDKIGGGADVTRKIAAAGINVHYSYATSAAGRRYGVVFQTANNAKTIRVLNR